MAVEIEPEIMLCAAIIKRAILDAHSDNERLRQEAIDFLWTYCPEIATQAGIATDGAMNYCQAAPVIFSYQKL